MKSKKDNDHGRDASQCNENPLCGVTTQNRMPPVPHMAEYVPNTHPSYTGNPLNDALPIIKSDRDWYVQLTNGVQFDPSQRTLDAYLRSYFVANLKNLFIPTGQHIILARRIDQLVRMGYRGRHPQSPERAAILHETYSKAQERGKAVKIVFNETKPFCTFSLIGHSGAGKSTTFENILGAYPQCLFHPTMNLTQLVWIKVDCPKDGSVKELAYAILNAFDEVLGTQHAPKRNSRFTADMCTSRVSHLAVAYNLGVLVIDELQNLSAKKSGGREEMLNWFQELVNTVRLPVVALGTYKARSVLQLDLRHARRLSVFGSEIWDPLDKNGDFDQLVGNMWRYTLLREPGKLTDEMRAVIHEETQGIRAFIVDMFVVAQLHALGKGIETMTPEFFRQVAREEFAAVQPMLNALRSKDPNRIRRFEDLMSYKVDEYIERARKLIPSGAEEAPEAPDPGASVLGRACVAVQAYTGLTAAETRKLVLSVMDGSHRTSQSLTRASIARYHEQTESDVEGEATCDAI